MKGILLIILFAAVIVVLVFTTKSQDSGGKTYPQKLTEALDQAESMALDLKINDIKAALNMYNTDKSQYPETLDMLVPDYLRNEDQTQDPWGRRFKIEADDENVTLISAGKDRVFGTKDDIRRRIL